MTVIANPPFPAYLDVNGSPINDGYLYFGVANQNPETNPITVYWDAAYSEPASQPIRTSGGFAVRNGTPANLYVSTDFSLTVRDKNRRLVYSRLTAEGQFSAEVDLQFSTQTITATSGQTVFSLTTAYTPGNQSLAVYHNGSRLVLSQDYLETSSTSIALLIGANTGDVLQFVTATPINPSSMGAAAVAYIPAGAGGIATDVQTVLRETTSVKRYGAKGDGLVDDSSAINNAIDAVYNAGGGVVWFPVGRYLLSSPILLKPGVSLIGDQKGKFGAPSTFGVVFVRNFTTSSATIYSPSSQTIDGVTYENFIIEGGKNGIGGTSTSGHGIEIQLGNDILFKRVWVSQCPGDGFRIGQGAASFHNYFYNCYAFFNAGTGYSARSDWMRFIDCWSDGNKIGIEFPSGAQAGSNAFIYRCHFEEWEDYAIKISGVSAFGGTGNNQIVGCRLFSRRYNVSMLGHGIFLDGVSSTTGASGNTLRDNHFVYQNSYGVNNAGTVGIIVGATADSNVLDNNRISAFDTGIRTDATSARSSLIDNNVYANSTGLVLAGINEILRGHISQANTTSATITASGAKLNQCTFEAAVSLPAGTYASDNVNAGGGTYTPVLTFGGASVGITYSLQSGRWQQSGRTVTVWVQIVLTNKGSSVGIAALSLPVAPTGIQALGLVDIYTGGASITAQPMGAIKPGSGRLELVQGFPASALTNANFTNTTALVLSATYEV